jgi:predicted ArsR family transcriptional regulator
MVGTRAQIVELLRRHGELTVAALSRELGIAAPALRRHLDILAAEGMVAYRTVKQAAGRPYFRFYLTEQAQEAASTGYARLLERLVVDAAALPAGDGSSRAMLDLLLDRLADHLAEDYRSRVHGNTLEERVRSLTEALRSEGILDQWERREDGIHLYNAACPHRRAALAAHELCGSERRAIAKLLGEDVDQIGRMVDGQSCCEYVVRPRQDTGPQLVTITG